MAYNHLEHKSPMKKGQHLIAILEKGIEVRPKIAQRTSRKLLKEWGVILN